jgi:acyl-CoA synthetase (AMP-forming)/AMP-acid ligase II
VRPITCGGEVSFPDELEAVLRYHPAVADAAVTGLPHLTLGSHRVAPVSARPDQQAPDTEQVHRFGVGRLTGFKVPGEVLAVDAVRRHDRRIDYDWERATAEELPGIPAIR